MNDSPKQTPATPEPVNASELVHPRKNQTPTGLNDVRNPKSQQPHEPTDQQNRVIRQPR